MTSTEDLMIELFYWPTPNGHKITLFLEEAGLDYKISRIDISKGEQFKADFLQIAPNNRMPAIIDHKPADGGAPISIFESGAILWYLAEKTGKFLPTDTRGKVAVSEWLFWQMAGLGPMAGQAIHFRRYAPEPVPYAVARYTDEVNRLYGVMNTRLAQHEFWPGVIPSPTSRASVGSVSPSGKARILPRSATSSAGSKPYAPARQSSAPSPSGSKRHPRLTSTTRPCARCCSGNARNRHRTDVRASGAPHFARVQVCDLQITLITQPLRSAVFAPVMVNEPE
jgi:GST-like protein